MKRHFAVITGDAKQSIDCRVAMLIAMTMKV
jgi:hypothetical protein